MRAVTSRRNRTPFGPITLDSFHLRTELLTVALAPCGLDVPVGDAIVHDPAEPLVAGPGDVVLAVAVDPVSEAAHSLVAACAAALVVKHRDQPIERLLDVASEAGVAVLVTPAEVAWGQLHALIRTSATTAGTSGARVSGTAIGDLFTLADAIAAAAGGRRETSH